MMTTLIILFVFVALATVTEARNVENDCDSWKNIDWCWKRREFSAKEMARKCERIGKYHCYAGFEDADGIESQLADKM